ncbi:MAG: hypothetical protein CK552_06350 [Actinobacteria bacterium]|nr:MAG: hypothetical protein CK552_06350 [Actinomycetota bacterium]
MDDVEIRFLRADEAHILTDLVTDAYGSTYDADWVYEPAEISQRIEAGALISTIGVLSDGTVAGHMALMREEPDASVLHAGVAVVTEAARGHHLFTSMKQYAALWAKGQGVLGIFSEATAAHPYSQKANIDLGAHETGFLLGWIPDSVSNDAALAKDTRRQSVALFYLKENDGHDRPIYAPTRHRGIIENIVTATGISGRVVKASHLNVRGIGESTSMMISHKEDHNLAIITVHQPGRDLSKVVLKAREELVTHAGRDAVYLDLPLNDPATEIILDADLTSLGFAFAGVFPNKYLDGDALRLQSLHNVDIHAADISTASDHGRELLSYVLSDVTTTQANRN